MQAKIVKEEDANNEPRAIEMRAELARKVAENIRADGVHATGITGMSLYRRSAPTACMSAAYEPRLIVFVQGQKRINLGKATYLCDASTFLLTSVDLPVVSQVTKATKRYRSSD